MALYTYGGTPSDVLTTPTGDVVPDYLLLVRAAGTGAPITALVEADGTTPIAELRSNPATSGKPGAIRTFKIADVSAIEYEFLDAAGQPVRWYQAAREVPAEALAVAGQALPRSGGTLTGPVTAAHSMTVLQGLHTAGGITADEIAVFGDLVVGGLFAPASISLAGMGVFNPRVLGALGNGIADDAPAIQAALSAAAGAGGGWVIVPPGTYRLATLPLRIYRHTRLTLMPGATFVRAAGATMLLNGDADQAFGGYTGHGDLLIEGGVWDMQATAPGLTASRMCMSLGHAEGIAIRDVVIRDVPGFHAIEVNACKGVRITDSRFLGFTDPGGRDLSEAVQIDLATDVGAFGGFGPYDSTACDDIEIRGCHFGASGTPGTTAWARGIGTHNARIGRWQRDIRIDSCTFEGMIQYAVGGYNWEDVTITGCVMRACGAGVRMRSVDSTNTNHTKTPDGTQTSASQPMRAIAVTGNTISDSTGYDDSIVVEGEATGPVAALAITGNIIDGTADAENGLRLVQAVDYTVGDNAVIGTDGTAISQQDCTGGTISGNRCSAPTGSGITANACTRLKIADNAIAAPGAVGVWIVGGTGLAVEGNRITSPSRAVAGAGHGIRASSGATDIRIVGNTVRRNGSGNEMGYALSVTSACSGIERWGNDFDAGTLGIIDDQSPNPELSPMDASGALEELMRPPGRYETTSRLRCGGDVAPASGVLYLVPLWLPRGAVISNIAFVSGATAGAGLTNHWFTLHDRARVALARTADATTAAWAANTAKSLALAQTTAGAASSYTTTYSGLHYLGVMVAGTTPPSLLGEGRCVAQGTVSPGMGGTNTAQTAPPTVTAGAFTAAAFAAAPILAYAYTT
ncbi:right-handed parallel beta-helix repeat-containing protein [Streptomyces uncialis]|uniref:right-handed parallel beta-helix repeat-containing protein n=1 Tax=Streptomyces uncialis TaxID=1048205 RepID=UPI0022554BEE|nr:right-handed parallel beta-helix repeat-containing protein [Streptomyces uncialis]MCX4661509.1 right-handed parallel beta-helix repeat-containing protein [Streptomyces uncialis]